MTPHPLWKFPKNSLVLVAVLVPKYHQVYDIGSVTTCYRITVKEAFLFSQNQYQHFDLDEFQQFSENILISSPHNFWMGFLNFNLVPTMVVSLAVQRNQTNFHYWNSFQNLFIYIQLWTGNHKVFLCISAFLLKW